MLLKEFLVIQLALSLANGVMTGLAKDFVLDVSKRRKSVVGISLLLFLWPVTAFIVIWESYEQFRLSNHL